MIASLNAFPGMETLAYTLRRPWSDTVVLEVGDVRMDLHCPSPSACKTVVLLLEEMGVEKKDMGPSKGLHIHFDFARKHTNRHSIEFVNERGGVEQTFEIEFLH